MRECEGCKQLAARLAEVERLLTHLPARFASGGATGGGGVTVGSTTPQVTASGAPGSAETAMRSDAQPRGQIGSSATATPDSYQYLVWEDGKLYATNSAGDDYVLISHFQSTTP